MTIHRLTGSGQRIEVRSGDTLEISVPEPGATGFVWDIARQPAGTVLAGTTVEMRTGAPGATGLRRFRFVVDGHADGDLVLELRRPWEPAGAPGDTFTAQLVAPAGSDPDQP